MALALLLAGLIAVAVPACGSRNGSDSGCGTPLQVGIVTDVPVPADATFGPSFWQGVVDHVNQDADVCARAGYLVSNSRSDYSRNIELFVARGARLVVTAGPALASATQAAAAAHPKVMFAALDTKFASPPRNLIGAVIREDEAGYLAGALAAMLSRTGVVGAVFGPSDGPLVHRYGEGFRNGAAYVSGAARAFVVYASHEPGIVSNFAWGSARAEDEISQDADVFMGGGGDAGRGALVAARQAGILCMGTVSDAFYADPQARACLVTSAVQDDGEVVAQLARFARSGRPPAGGLYEAGVGAGAVGLAPFHWLSSRVPAALRTRLEKITDELAAGTLDTGVSF